MCYKIMIWANVTKFGQNFIAPHIFLAGTPMQPINDIALKRNTICKNVRYSPQHNSKVGWKSFDNFRLPQANCDKYFLKLHFLN